MASAAKRQLNFGVLLGLAWLLIVVQLLAQNWTRTGLTLIDTDDAMRLAQLHDWVGGQGWYDLNQGRIAGGYESHWSRLIDAGLAGTLWIFGVFFEGALAERLMRTAWPMLWLLPAMAGIVAVAWRIAGRNGALVALVLMTVGGPAFAQFVPGRIDHHNVQIALAMLVTGVTVWSDRVRWAAPAAGALTGLALAIGLECLPYLAVCGVAFAVRLAFDRGAAPMAARYGVALAASTAIAFIVIVPPAHWMQGVCDEIAINWAGPVVIGGLGLALAASVGPAHAAWRAGLLLATGGAALALFLAIEPRCVRGPYALMDPALWQVWLAHVTEMQPWLTMTRNSPAMGAGFAAFPLVALACTLWLAREGAIRRNFGLQVAAAMMVVALIMMMMAIKMSAYALWLGMPAVAAWVLRLTDRLQISTFAARLFVSIMLGPAVLSVAALTVVQAAARAPAESEDHRFEAGCFKTASYAPLAELPPGLVATDIDFGPFLLALTRHAILSAPYHRLSASIIATQELLAASLADARGGLSRRRITYVVMCGRSPLLGGAEDKQAASLWHTLQGGAVPDWLERVPVAGPFVVYRMKS